MIDPNCAVNVGTHHGPYWTADNRSPEWKVCDRHRQQFNGSDLGPFLWRPAPAPVEDAQEPPATPEWVKALGDAVDRAKAETRLAQEPPVEERCGWCGRAEGHMAHGINGHFYRPPTARPETEVER